MKPNKNIVEEAIKSLLIALKKVSPKRREENDKCCKII